jgi:hypothetical protein
MTNRATAILVTILVILVGIGAYYALRDTGPNGAPTNGTGQNGGTVNNGTGATTTPPVSNDMIRVTSPTPNSSVRSPLTITGEARGGWYFEASFPVEMLDANGRRLGIHYAEAQGEWMTNKFVPFRSTLTFSTPTTSTGTLVLHKDNPSDMRELDDKIEIPIRFEQSSTQTRNINLYFYDERRDRDANGNVICSAQGLVAIPRTIAHTNTPIQDAVRELLKGPTTVERSQVPGTEFPLQGVTLTSASLSNGVLTLRFNDPQNSTSGGSCRIAILTAQIERTAAQFGGVNSVRYLPEEIFQP